VSAAPLARDERLARAVAAQQLPPAAVVDGAGGLASAIAGALATGSDWIWVLDGSALPRDDALAALVAALRHLDGLVAPDLLTGVVVGAGGRVEEAGALWCRRDQVDLALDAADRRLVPVRAALGSVLVRRDAAAADPPADRAASTPAALVEWTARLLRRRTGYLVTASEADAVAPGYDPAGEPRTAARLLLGGALPGFDRLRYGIELVERVRARSARR
jgi:hypothetical protein